MKIDFAKFDGVLPYASELYGVYQPLIGWRSRLTQERAGARLRLAAFPRELDLVSGRREGNPDVDDDYPQVRLVSHALFHSGFWAGS